MRHAHSRLVEHLDLLFAQIDAVGHDSLMVFCRCVCVCVSVCVCVLCECVSVCVERNVSR